MKGHIDMITIISIALNIILIALVLKCYGII